MARRPHVHGMEAVDILVGVDGQQNPGLVDLPRQGQLHQDAVNCRVGVQLRDQAEQLAFGGRPRTG